MDFSGWIGLAVGLVTTESEISLEPLLFGQQVLLPVEFSSTLPLSVLLAQFVCKVF
jgi:hypothetical protein